MHSRLGHFIRRIKLLRSCNAPPKTDRRTVDDIIEEYLDAGHVDMVALADALGFTPLELYKAANKQAAPVRCWLPKPYREQCEQHRLHVFKLRNPHV